MKITVAYHLFGDPTLYFLTVKKPCKISFTELGFWVTIIGRFKYTNKESLFYSGEIDQIYHRKRFRK